MHYMFQVHQDVRQLECHGIKRQFPVGFQDPSVHSICRHRKGWVCRQHDRLSSRKGLFVLQSARQLVKVL